MKQAALSLLAALAALVPASTSAQEVFVGVYAHGVDTPFTLETFEGGADLAVGVRLGEIGLLSAIGSPAPYAVGVLNSSGDTSFVGGGLSWTFDVGPVYVRPGAGLVVQDGPELRTDAVTGRRTDLGSRVLFEPEIGVGLRLSERLSAEASWMHISHARLFNREQNPGIDMLGLRLVHKLR